MFYNKQKEISNIVQKWIKKEMIWNSLSKFINEKGIKKAVHCSCEKVTRRTKHDGFFSLYEAT